LEDIEEELSGKEGQAKREKRLLRKRRGRRRRAG